MIANKIIAQHAKKEGRKLEDIDQCEVQESCLILLRHESNFSC